MSMIKSNFFHEINNHSEEMQQSIAEQEQRSKTQPLVNGKSVKEGDFAMVFDADKWHVDKGDNSEFWNKGKVLKVYWYNSKIGSSDWVVDVQFEDGRISKAHFLNTIEPID